MINEFKNVFQRPNNAHVRLIVINVVIFLALGIVRVISNIGGFPDVFDSIFVQLALPAKFSLFLEKPWTLITHAFVHDFSSILHIFFNMLFFFWFGRLLVEYLGSDKLIAIYVLGFLSGAIFILLTHNLIPYYIAQNNAIGFGASAAVNAVMMAAATLLPEYTFFLLFLGPVKIKYIAFFYVVVSFLGTVGANAGGDVAHLGGALMGYIYIKQLQAGINWGNWITATLDWIQDLFKSKPHVKVTYRGEEKKPKKGVKVPVSKSSQDEIDAILDKISERGYESLTKEEKEKLFNASKK